MKIVLIASFCSIDADEDAEILRVFGYDVITWYEMHRMDYHLNVRKEVPTDSMVRDFLRRECFRGRVLVLHADAPRFLREEVLAIAMEARGHVIERWDLAQHAKWMTLDMVKNANLFGRMIYRVSDAPAPLAYREVKPQQLSREVCGTTAAPLRVVRNDEELQVGQTYYIPVQPAVFSAGEVKEKMNRWVMLRERLTWLIARLRRWEQRVKSALSLRHEPTAQTQPKPVPYRLNTTPLPTTA